MSSDYHRKLQSSINPQTKELRWSGTNGTSPEIGLVSINVTAESQGKIRILRRG